MPSLEKVSVSEMCAQSWKNASPLKSEIVCISPYAYAFSELGTLHEFCCKKEKSMKTAIMTCFLFFCSIGNLRNPIAERNNRKPTAVQAALKLLCRKLSPKRQPMSIHCCPFHFVATCLFCGCVRFETRVHRDPSSPHAGRPSVLPRRY